MTELTSKVALITGGSKGIGRAIALAYGKLGITVALTYMGDKDSAHDVVLEIESDGGKALAIHADVGNEANIKAMVVTARDAFGQINILVNNAGITMAKPWQQVTCIRRHCSSGRMIRRLGSSSRSKNNRPPFQALMVFDREEVSGKAPGGPPVMRATLSEPSAQTRQPRWSMGVTRHVPASHRSSAEMRSIQCHQVTPRATTATQAAGMIRGRVMRTK